MADDGYAVDKVLFHCGQWIVAAFNQLAEYCVVAVHILPWLLNALMESQGLVYLTHRVNKVV